MLLNVILRMKANLSRISLARHDSSEFKDKTTLALPGLNKASQAPVCLHGMDKNIEVGEGENNRCS